MVFFIGAGLFARGSQLLVRFALNWTGLADPNSCLAQRHANSVPFLRDNEQCHCPFCSLQMVETREHVLFHCSAYDQPRYRFLRDVHLTLDEFCRAKRVGHEQVVPSRAFMALPDTTKMACLIFPERLLTEFSISKGKRRALVNAIAVCVTRFLESVYYSRGRMLATHFPQFAAYSQSLWPMAALDCLH